MPCRPGRKRGPRPGKRKLVPPLNAPEVYCAASCGFSMILSRAAMEANSRGRAIVWDCPQCEHKGNRVEPRTCPTPQLI